MNLKIFTLSILFLFYIGNTSAQNSSPAPVNDISDIVLRVEDVGNKQKFTLETDSIQYFTPGNGYRFRIFLDYQSEANNITYFKLQYSFAVIHSDGSIDDTEPLQGITAPVIIPPVKKNTTINSFSSISSGAYPHSIQSLVPLFPRNYMVTIKLFRYHERQSYMTGNNNYNTEDIDIEYTLKPYSNPAPLGRSSFNIITYPNPSTNHIVFEYPNTSDKSTISKQFPIGVTIFNDKGVKISQHSLTNTSSKANSISYSLNTSHLQKGRYYFQLSYEGKTQVKTILKE